MRYPVNYINITNGFHVGLCLDFGFSSKYKDEEIGGKNQPIFACDDGVVYKIEVQKTGGNVIWIQHKNGYVSYYAHLSKILVKKNDVVKIGQQIGCMGDTGSSARGYHLHFGIYSNIKLANTYGNSDISPFEVCEVYEDQTIKETTIEKYGNYLKYHPSNPETTSQLWLHSEPNFKEETNIALMNKGIPVEILGEENGCYHIRLEGYASKNYIK